jgi:hypothetical protein
MLKIRARLANSQKPCVDVSMTAESIAPKLFFILSILIALHNELQYAFQLREGLGGLRLPNERQSISRLE